MSNTYEPLLSPNPIRSTPSGPTIDSTTIFSLLSTLLILGIAYFLSIRLLPQNAPTRTRILFIWHAFDTLIHTFLEGSYVLNCFTAYTTLPQPLEDVSLSHPASWHGRAWNDAIARGYTLFTAPGVSFLAQPGRLYGSWYAGPADTRGGQLGGWQWGWGRALGALWSEYAKADRRWGGADATLVSMELLTVCLGAPLAAWVCYLCVKGDRRVWLWAGWLAVGELYGGECALFPLSNFL
jgi:hypothetical protein